MSRKALLLFWIGLVLFVSIGPLVMVEAVVCSNPPKFYEHAACANWCRFALQAQRGGACRGGICTCFR